MTNPVIRVENLSKHYRLGVISGATLRGDLSRWWSRMRNRPDPYARLSEAGNGNGRGEIWALKDVSFEVREGKILGIIGHNGAGKSTLLKILSRITAPTSGRAIIRGRVGSLLEVGTGFHPELTGRENIFLNGAILGMTKAEVSRKFDEIVAFAEIEKFIETPIKRYSSGMTVRLAFAVAAHLEPEILIIDEVLAVGDAAFQKKCLGKMGEVASHGRTVLFVSHNMGMVNALCDEVVLMSKGQVVFDGSPETTIDRYLDGEHKASGDGITLPFKVDADVLASQEFSELTIDKISIESRSGADNKIKTGDSLQIQIFYSARDTLASPAFVAKVKNHVGQELIRLSTMPISGYQLGETFKKGEVVLTIDELPLVAGRYYLDVGFVRERVEWLIRLENVVRFDVHLNDVYQSGFPLDSTKGSFVVKHTWDHHEQAKA